MKCCGEERTGKFCSECGKTLMVGALWELYMHCSTVAGKHASQSTKGRPHRPASWSTEMIDKENALYKEDYRKRAEKWQTWADELRKLIEKDCGNG